MQSWFVLGDPTIALELGIESKIKVKNLCRKFTVHKAIFTQACYI